MEDLLERLEKAEEGSRDVNYSQIFESALKRVYIRGRVIQKTRHRRTTG